MGAEKNGWITYPCEVRQGTRRDAVLFSVGANADHGLRRTNADKRRAVEVLLRDEEWKQWNDHEIGRQCNVSHHTVAKVREELYPPVTRQMPSEKTYKTKHGTTAKMKTGNIGKSKASPSPVLLPQAPQSTLSAPVEVEDLQRETALQLRQQGMTQEKTAAVVGVDETTISKWESGSNLKNQDVSSIPDLRVSVPRSSHAHGKAPTLIEKCPGIFSPGKCEKVGKIFADTPLLRDPPPGCK
jgi:DNA-binding transcriptional regulator YiaG